MTDSPSRQLSTILVDAGQDAQSARNQRRLGRTSETLVRQLAAVGLQASVVAKLPVDIVWVSGGKQCMFDLKTAEDMIAAVDDGRLFRQMQAMRERDCLIYGFILEDNLTEDGITVGYGTHSWSFERFDNLLASLQAEGAMIVRSASQERTPQRLLQLYKWSGKEEHGSWQRPAPHRTLNNRYTDRIWRAHVEMLMGLPGLGENKANALLDRFSLMDILGVSPEGLAAAQARWLQIPGIGKKLAAGWATFIEQDFSSPFGG